MSQTWDSQSHDLLVEQVSQSMGQDNNRIYGGVNFRKPKQVELPNAEQHKLGQIWDLRTIS